MPARLRSRSRRLVTQSRSASRPLTSSEASRHQGDCLPRHSPTTTASEITSWTRSDNLWRKQQQAPCQTIPTVSATHDSLMNNLEEWPDRPHTIRTRSRPDLSSVPIGLLFCENCPSILSCIKLLSDLFQCVHQQPLCDTAAPSEIFRICTEQELCLWQLRCSTAHLLAGIQWHLAACFAHVCRHLGKHGRDRWNLELLKERDRDTMSIDSVKSPIGRHCSENLQDMRFFGALLQPYSV